MKRRITAIAILALILILLAVVLAYAHFHSRTLAPFASVPSENPGVITDAEGNPITNANQVIKNLETDYGGVSSTTINQAITDAKAYFASNPDTVYIIQIPEGTFTIGGSIDVSDVKPGLSGRLVFEGAGMASTTLVQDGSVYGVTGNNTYRTSFIGIHFTLPSQSTTQGTVVAAAPGQVTVSVPPGFPSPLSLMDPHYDLSQACPQSNQASGGWGRYLKSFIASTTDPEITDPNQDSVPWCKPVAVAGTTTEWTLLLRQSKLDPYTVGTLLAIKSKDVASTYWFCGGDDFVFQDIEWTGWSRGNWRCGFNDVLLDHVEVVRQPAIDGQVPVLSTTGGGPQLGQMGTPSGGYTIKDSYFDATGDDTIAFFDATGTVEDTQVYDSFGRVNINDSQVQLINDNIVRTRLVQQDKTKGSD